MQNVEQENKLSKSDAKLIDFGLSVLSPRWTSEILIDLASGPKRTTQLLRNLEGVSAKTLCQRLRKLSELSLVRRETFAEVPPRVEYSLTRSGKELSSILFALKSLGGELFKNQPKMAAISKADDAVDVDCMVDLAVDEFSRAEMSASA